MLQYPELVKKFFAKPGTPFPKGTLRVIQLPKGPKIHLKSPRAFDGQVYCYVAAMFLKANKLCMRLFASLQHAFLAADRELL